MAASDVTSGPHVDEPMGQAPALELDEYEFEEEEPGGTMTLVEHLEELRRRLIISALALVVATILSFFFWEPILRFLLTPLPTISNKLTGFDGHKLVASSPLEPFTVALKLSFAVGVCLATPVVLYQLWGFISPGLTRKERKYALPFTLLGAALFVVGLAVGFLVLRYPMDWLIHFGNGDFILLLNASSYFSFVAFFLLAFGIVFELPLLITFLGIVGIVSSAWLRKRQKYILFGLWLLSCFITPGADPFSPLIIGVSFTVLFELSLLLLRVLKK